MALSASKLEVDKKTAIPCVELDLLFVNNLYRKNRYKELDNNTLGKEIMTYALAIILDLSTKLGIQYVILTPLGQEEKLIKFYSAFGFQAIPTKKDWMYLKISDIQKETNES